MIYEQDLRAVDPLSLAAAAGGYKARRFSAPIPQVATPFLLTGQLKRGLGLGDSCCGSCSSGGMAAAMIPPDYGTMRGMRKYVDMPEGLGSPEDGYGMAWAERGPGLGVYACPTTYNPQALGVPSAGSGNVSILQTASVGLNFIPGIGTIGALSITALKTMLGQFESWFHIGAGRREADIIVPVQNQMMAHLGTITNSFLTGTSPSVTDLQGYYRDVWATAVGFQEFVLMCNFTDRRASGQALNTVMPYIDGSCGYSVPVGPQATPSQQNCLTWGDGTLGGPGTTGMLGALARAITNAGGSVPTLPDVHQSANMGIRPTQITPPVFGIGGLPATIMGVSTPLALFGIVALYLYSKKGSF